MGVFFVCQVGKKQDIDFTIMEGNLSEIMYTSFLEYRQRDLYYMDGTRRNSFILSKRRHSYSRILYFTVRILGKWNRSSITSANLLMSWREKEKAGPEGDWIGVGERALAYDTPNDFGRY